MVADPQEDLDTARFVAYTNGALVPEVKLNIIDQNLLQKEFFIFQINSFFAFLRSLMDILPLILDTLPQKLILDILPQQFIRDIPILTTPFLPPPSTLLITDIPTLTVPTYITPTTLSKPQLFKNVLPEKPNLIV